MTTVDVMFPYYGDVDLMKAAVNSVLSQQNPNWRLVIIDDGFPDPEPERWLTEIASRDSRVTYQRNEKNLGANGNYRKALGLVETEFFVMMGADDIMQPNYLDVILRNFAAFPRADVVQPGVQTINENSVACTTLPDRVKKAYAPKATGVTTLSGERMATSLLKADWAYFPSLAWRTETVKRLGFREGYDVVQDLALLLDIAAENGTMVIDPELAFLYRRHMGSDSMVKALNGYRFNEERRFFQWQTKRFSELGWKSSARAARNRFTSRLNALSLMAQSVAKGKFSSLGTLGKHVVS